MSKLATSPGEDKWLSDNEYIKQDVPIPYYDKKGIGKRSYPDLILYNDETKELVIVEYKYRSELNKLTHYMAAETKQRNLREDTFKPKPKAFIDLYAWSNSIHKQIVTLQHAKIVMKSSIVKFVIVNPAMQLQRAKSLNGDKHLKVIFNHANKHHIEMLTPHEFNNLYGEYKQRIFTDREMVMLEYIAKLLMSHIESFKLI